MSLTEARHAQHFKPVGNVGRERRYVWAKVGRGEDNRVNGMSQNVRVDGSDLNTQSVQAFNQGVLNVLNDQKDLGAYHNWLLW
jgi:hypothetical protein